MGGDSRLEIDPKTGRNRYACQSRPGRAVPFGSCTSSTVSPRGFAAAAETHRQIVSAQDSAIFANECSNTMRERLRQMLGLPLNVDIAFGPSGTDVEMLALALAAGGCRRPVMNILVGPREVGSGTPQAAGCRHYDQISPNGMRVTPNQPVDAELASLVEVRNVELRTSNGAMLPESEIDAAVIELVLEASQRDAIVLLHVVAHSKTGVHAPSLACVERLRTAADDVVVVVDAAQGRFSRRGLRDVLERDYMVIFTGSKFYGGPPFSGALLVPQKFRPANRRLERLPNGFGAYFTAAELPESWMDVRRSMPSEPNVGGLLRWSAALAEMDAYYQVPSQLRLGVLRFFEAEVPRVFSESPCIRMLPVFGPVYDDTAHRLLESKTTVFGFWVTPPGGSEPLGKAELKQMHQDLSVELTLTAAGMNRDYMLGEYHLGQPVELGPAGCVLRVALGGELITRVATDRNIGETFDNRLAWLRGHLFSLRRKIECLAGTYSPVNRAMANVAASPQAAFDTSWISSSPIAMS
jgi:hypothetical protein